MALLDRRDELVCCTMPYLVLSLAMLTSMARMINKLHVSTVYFHH